MIARKMFMLMHPYDLVNPKTEVYHFMKSDIGNGIENQPPPEESTACGMEAIDRKAHWAKRTICLMPGTSQQFWGYSSVYMPKEKWCAHIAKKSLCGTLVSCNNATHEQSTTQTRCDKRERKT